MRIKDLATRATKLLAGNSWFAVDNGSKVDKVGYSAMVKEAIEEYNGTSLAGSNQSVKSAVDALNSKSYPELIILESFQNIIEVFQQSTVKVGAVYSLNMVLQTLGTLTSGEKAIGDLSIQPYAYISGAIINNGNTSIAGAFIVTGTGRVYINLEQDVPANSKLRFCCSVVAIN